MTNEAQIQAWNEANAERWIRARHAVCRPLNPFGDAALAALDPRPGESVLDVGCGFGDTTRALARRTGSALGIDVSEPFLRIARAEAEGGARYLLADAQTHRFDERFDLCFSRFGVMFFADPAAAFANLRSALREGGRFAAVAWGPWQENEWGALPIRIARRHLPVPDPTSGPGPFSLGSPGRFEEVLRGAGFQAVSVRRIEAPFEVEAAQLVDQGPAAAHLRETGASEEVRGRIAAELARELSGRTPGAVVLLATARS